MQLKDFLKANAISAASIAREWRCATSTVTRAMNGQGPYPSFLLIVRAYIVSGGKVGLTDWIEAYRTRLHDEGVLPRGAPLPKPGGADEKRK